MKLHAKIGFALSAVALAALTACGSTTPGTSASGTSAGTTQATTTLHTANTALGTILVNGAGMTLYYYDADKVGESASALTIRRR